MADRADKTGAVVIGNSRGSHFGNEVLNWHRIGTLDADEVLPGLLITKTHPSYFRESFDDSKAAAPGLEDLLVIPLKPFCKDETDFLRAIEGIFHDLKDGLELKNFRIASHDHRRHRAKSVGKRLVDAIEVKPGAFGVSLDLKALLLPAK